MSDPVRLVVCGAAGRMGRLLVALAREDRRFAVVGAVEAPGHPALGRDAGEVAGGAALGVALVGELRPICGPEQVVLDFTAPAAALAHARVAAECGAGLVVGTTGLQSEEDRELRAQAGRTRAVIAPARLLGEGFEAEIVELHHHDKKDAPSGTALALGRAVAAARDQDFTRVGVLARQGLVGARSRHEIGVVALRAGDVVGDHTVVFGGLGERLELVHRAQSRECLARGALRAA
ncbi:MAG: 4-hydroxy-tetrahydrodipicolinate reductase, partial [Deltaproteobacteria bacterium]